MCRKKLKLRKSLVSTWKKIIKIKSWKTARGHGKRHVQKFMEFQKIRRVRTLCNGSGVLVDEHQLLNQLHFEEQSSIIESFKLLKGHYSTAVV